jgi:hypothetical protein
LVVVGVGVVVVVVLVQLLAVAAGRRVPTIDEQSRRQNPATRHAMADMLAEVGSWSPTQGQG